MGSGKGNAGTKARAQLPAEFKLPSSTQYDGLACAYLYQVGEVKPRPDAHYRVSLLRGPLCIIAGTNDLEQRNAVGLASRYTAEWMIPGALTQYERSHPGMVAQVRGALEWIAANA